MSSSSLLRKSHIALSPMNGAEVSLQGLIRQFFCIIKEAKTKTYSSIRNDFQYFLRSIKRHLSYLFSVPLRIMALSLT
jgi:hypothetical protein